MLGDELFAVLPEHRANAESRMSERLVFFTVVEGEDPVTLQPVQVETVMFADRFPDGVPARVRSSARESRDVPIAGQVPVVSQLRVDVPVGSVRVGPSVMVRVVASSVDPGLVGSVFRTKDSAVMGQVTAWRYPVEQVS